MPDLEIRETEERRCPRDKTIEQLGLDEEFVRGVREEQLPSPSGQHPPETFAGPSRIKLARDRFKALIRDRKLCHFKNFPDYFDL
jgi:carbamoylphosphate synthase small subunit